MYVYYSEILGVIFEVVVIAEVEGEVDVPNGVVQVEVVRSAGGKGE